MFSTHVYNTSLNHNFIPIYKNKITTYSLSKLNIINNSIMKHPITIKKETNTTNNNLLPI
jgi:hypothetical protein